VLIVILFLSAPNLRTSSAQPVRGHQPYTGQSSSSPWNPPSPKDAPEGETPDRHIVKAKLESEDASWISKLESTWHNDIITIKPIFPHLHPQAHRPDKGRIASAYLRWIVEHYNHLPETTVFLPPTDPFVKDTFDLRDAISSLQIPFIQTSGYANLHCPVTKSLTTCNDKVLNVAKPSHEFRVLEAKIPAIWEELFDKEVAVPERLASVLGATFVVSREQLRKRSVEELVKFWTWLEKTIMDDDSAGLVWEYLWHVVFGKGEMFCPERGRCECDLYGKC
jgi:hypothetical protein